MYKSPTPLSEKVRQRIADGLNDRLVDGLDLHSQIKVAHWNIKGPHFAALHPLFETFAVSLGNHNDAIAERAVTLGALAHGTARHVAQALRASRVPAEHRQGPRAREAPGRADREVSRRLAQDARSWAKRRTTSTPWTCSPASSPSSRSTSGS